MREVWGGGEIFGSLVPKLDLLLKILQQTSEGKNSMMFLRIFPTESEIKRKEEEQKNRTHPTSQWLERYGRVRAGTPYLKF